MGVGIKIFDGKGLHLVEEIITQATHGPLPNGDHDAVVRETGHHAHSHNGDEPAQLGPQPGEVIELSVEHGGDVVVH